MTALPVGKRYVDTTLNFFKPNDDGSPPAPAYMADPVTFERTPETHSVSLRDITGEEELYGLDSHGFQITPFVSEEKSFLDQGRIKDVFYLEIDQLLKKVTGASRIFIFDHTIRRPSAQEKWSSMHDADKKPPRPTYVVHVDQSYDSSLSRVAHHLLDDAERLLKGRVQIINVWKPIKTVRRDPLAVSQCQSVREDDLVPIGVIYPQGGRMGATLSVKYNEGQKWYYKSGMSPDEALLFKCFDSRAGAQGDPRLENVAKRVPHSACKIPGTEGEEERESIETRCLVFYDDDGGN